MKRFVFALILCLAGCMPHEQPYMPGDASAEVRDMTLRTADGAKLAVKAWLPEGAPRFVLVGLHGINDYGNAFAIPGEYLRQRGVALYAYDQRGFGSSIGRGIWPGRDNLAADLAGMVKALRALHPGTPLYILGESMGGAVATVAVSQPGFPKVDGVILVAPAVWGGDTMNPLYRVSLWIMAHTLPDYTFTGEGMHILASDNIPMLRAMGADPLIIKATRTDAIYGLVGLMDDAYDDLARLEAPTLVLYGANDQVVPPFAVAGAMRHAGSHTRFAFYPAGFHMLLRDLQGNVPLNDILAWLADHEAKLPSGGDALGAQWLEANKPPALTVEKQRSGPFRR